jgi:hypothetical protein
MALSLSPSLCEWRRLHVLRVEGSSHSRNGGLKRPQGGPGRPRTILARFGRGFAPVGPHVFMHIPPPFAPF